MCGVHVGAQNYSLELRTYGDESYGETIPPLAAALAQADFLFGGTVDFQTFALSAISAITNKVLVSGAGGASALFQDYPTAFSTFPDYNRYFESSLRLVAGLGATTVAVVSEDSLTTAVMCTGVPAFAAANGLTIVDWSSVRPPWGKTERERAKCQGWRRNTQA